MKLITWNCARGFAKKSQLLFDQNPDIAIVQECSEPHAKAAHSDYESLWFGKPGSIGVAVFYKKSHWHLTLLAKPTHNWVIPLHVNGPEEFNLLAVWSCPESTGTSKYVNLVRDAIEANVSHFADFPTVVAGDFNSNSQWDGPADKPHANLVARLEELGLVSAYHVLRNERQGEEKDRTFHMRRKEKEHFHIDYVFVPPAWLERESKLEVGSFAEWCEHSDHRPLIFQIN